MWIRTVNNPVIACLAVVVIMVGLIGGYSLAGPPVPDGRGGFGDSLVEQTKPATTKTQEQQEQQEQQDQPEQPEQQEQPKVKENQPRRPTNRPHAPVVSPKKDETARSTPLPKETKAPIEKETKVPTRTPTLPPLPPLPPTPEPTIKGETDIETKDSASPSEHPNNR